MLEIPKGNVSKMLGVEKTNVIAPKVIEKKTEETTPKVEGETVDIKFDGKIETPQTPVMTAAETPKKTGKIKKLLTKAGATFGIAAAIVGAGAMVNAPKAEAHGPYGHHYHGGYVQPYHNHHHHHYNNYNYYNYNPYAPYAVPSPNVIIAPPPVYYNYNHYHGVDPGTAAIVGGAIIGGAIIGGILSGR